MPLLDHFHPPPHGARHWEGFHHARATGIAQQLNLEALPPGYFAGPEISLGLMLEIDDPTMEEAGSDASADRGNTAVWSPPRPKITARVDFSHLDSIEVRVYQDLGGAELRAAIEPVSPANNDRAGTRRTFAAKCAGDLGHGINVAIGQPAPRAVRGPRSQEPPGHLEIADRPVRRGVPGRHGAKTAAHWRRPPGQPGVLIPRPRPSTTTWVT